VVLGGELVPSAEATALRSVGGNVLHVTVVGDAFVPRVLLPGAASAALLAAIESTSEIADEPSGFNAIVRRMPTAYHPIPSHPIPSHPVPSHPSHPIPSHPIPSHPIPSRPIPSHAIP
jgi:hypothetical protein